MDVFIQLQGSEWGALYQDCRGGTLKSDAAWISDKGAHIVVLTLRVSLTLAGQVETSSLTSVLTAIAIYEVGRDVHWFPALHQNWSRLGLVVMEVWASFLSFRCRFHTDVRPISWLQVLSLMHNTCYADRVHAAKIGTHVINALCVKSKQRWNCIAGFARQMDVIVQR